jgi:hypothetical protein
MHVDVPAYCHRAAVDANGSIRWHGRKIHVSHALAHESVALFPIDGERWQFSYGPIELGTVDDNHLDRGLVPLRRRRRRGSIAKLSSMKRDVKDVFACTRPSDELRRSDEQDPSSPPIPIPITGA